VNIALQTAVALAVGVVVEVVGVDLG
jgi:hypothetical protein